MTSRFPINIMAPLLIGIPVLALGIWLSMMWNHESRIAVAELAHEKIEQIHELAALKIHDMTTMPPMICELNEDLIRDGDLDTSDLRSWHPRLFDELQAFEMLSSITWGSEDGRGLWVARYADGNFYFDLKENGNSTVMNEWRLNENGTIIEHTMHRFEWDLFSRPWYATPKSRGEASWTEPYLWAGGDQTDKTTVGVSYGLPLYREDGSLIGVIDADFQLGDLAEFLKTIETGRDGVVILSTDDGQLLAASNEIPFSDGDGVLQHLSTADDVVIAQMGVLVEETVSSHDVSETITIKNKSYYMHISPVGEEQGLDWQLVTIIPTNAFIGNIEAHFRQSMFLSIAAVIFVVIIASAMARWLLNPLSTLISKLKLVGEGHLDTKVQLGTAKEYVNLGAAINEMTSSLHASQSREQFLRRELDHRVKNMLAEILALCRQAADRSDTDRKLLDDLVSQVASLTGVHDLLGKRGAEGLHLRELIDSCSSPYVQSNSQIEKEGPVAFIKPNAAMCLALVTNELANNARKYGALSIENGLIRTSWSIDDPNGDYSGVLKWTWEEVRGVAPDGKYKNGFGTQMIEAIIPYEISGTASIDFNSNGLLFTATIPLNCFILKNEDDDGDEDDEQGTLIND
ncbi:MAG: hypothetical protein CMJ40_09740 [Phycisphaerae bacterium]|nr:hypothetical protein [Phycisphaerae bacterium]